MRDLRMYWFHIRQFSHNTYFLQLLITSTLGIVALLALASRNPGTILNDDGWLRAGMLGTWTVCAVSTGMLGYQRFQGTLVNLIRTPLAAARTLLPVVGAASTFGLLAIPLGLAAWLAMGQPVSIASPISLIVAILLFWLSCLTVSMVIGMLFVLTPNAITYESLVSIPLVLVSGVFGTPAWLPGWLLPILRILPTRDAVALLTSVADGHPLSPTLIISTIISSAIWFGISILASNIVTRKATSNATLEIV